MKNKILLFVFCIMSLCFISCEFITTPQMKPFYTISFDANGGEGSIDSQSGKAKDSIILNTNTFTFVGYVFAGWATSKDATTVEYADKASYTIGNSDVTFYAVWNVAQKITYNANGGEGTVESQFVYKGNSINLQDNSFTKDGYVFLGWASSATATSAEYNASAVYTIGTEDVTFYAVWSKAYTITYNANGGTGTVNSQSGYEGKSINIKSNSFTFSGYKFAGWASSATATTADYAEGATYTMGAADVTLYAVWSKVYTITYNANGGTGTVESQSGCKDDSITLSTNSFTYAGYLFAGWASSTTATTADYAEGATYTMGAADVTLYAVWSKAYTITYNANGGTSTVVSISGYNGEVVTLESSTCTRTGYALLGWASSATATTAEYRAGASYTLGAVDVTLYAVWSKLYTVSFDMNGGTGTVTSQSGVTGTVITISSSYYEYEKTGYTFVGWSLKADATTPDYYTQSIYGKNTITIEESDITLYAVWLKNYTITYDANGGTGTVSSQSGYEGESIYIQSNSFTCTGYKFAGWALSKDATIADYLPSKYYMMGSADVTLYAIWVLYEEHTITYNANGGTGTVSSQTGYAGNYVTLNSNSFTKDNFEFKGWALSADSTTVAYSNTARYLMGSTDITLYAVWATLYTITYDANGGTGSVSSQSNYTGESVNLRSNSFTKTGYAFVGWATSTDATTAEYAEEASYTIESSNITLYAVWKIANTFTSTISIPAEGEITFTETTTVIKGSTLTVAISETYSSYEWYLDAVQLTDFTTQSIDLDTTDYDLGSHTLTVFVTDSSGEMSSGSLYIIVTQ